MRVGESIENPTKILVKLHDSTWEWKIIK